MTKLLPRYLWPYRLPLSIVLVLVAVQAVSNLYLPNLMADIIDTGVIIVDKANCQYFVRK